MGANEIDKLLQEIVITRNKLSKLGYDNPQYDAVEEKMHQLEDDFQTKYGEKLKAVLQQVHEKHCTDTEVLHSIAYVGKSYTVNSKNQYEADLSAGVSVKLKENTKEDARLVVVPNPIRIVLNIGMQEQKVVWPEKAPSGNV